MTMIKVAIILRAEDIPGNALPAVLDILQGWPASIKLLLLAEAPMPPQITLPIGLEQVQWLESSALDDGETSLGLSLQKATEDVSHLLFLEARKLRPLAARLAALRRAALVTDVTNILSIDCCQRPVHAGQALATVQTKGNNQVWTLRSQVFGPLSCSPLQQIYPLQICPSVKASGGSIRVYRHPHCSVRPTLSQATIVVGGGRGVGQQQIPLLGTIADKLGAALGGTRALVDAGYLPEQSQIGQTGEQIAPRVYLACGISGAIQHVAGIGGSGTIIAVNSDPLAPIIRHHADYYLLGDVSEILPALLSQLAGVPPA